MELVFVQNDNPALVRCWPAAAAITLVVVRLSSLFLSPRRSVCVSGAPSSLDSQGESIVCDLLCGSAGSVCRRSVRGAYVDKPRRRIEVTIELLANCVQHWNAISAVEMAVRFYSNLILYVFILTLSPTIPRCMATDNPTRMVS